MARITHTLRASTLVELLVTMLVSGIILLSVMEGLTLFFRLQTRQTMDLMAAGREAAGYFRTESLIANADSIQPDGVRLTLFRGETRSELILRDSTLTYTSGEFCDTLLSGVSQFELVEYDRQRDSVEIEFGKFKVQFPVQEQATKRHRRQLEEIENEYGYEE